MDIVYKVTVAVLCAVVLASGGYALMMSHSNDIAANNYFETVTQTIVESDYNDDVIAMCIDEAKSYGFTLEVYVHGNKMHGTNKYAEITLTYTSEIKLFGVSVGKTKQKII